SHDASMLKRYVIATPEKRQTLSGMFQDVEHRLAAANTYRSGVQLMQTLSQVQQDLRGIYDQFYKQYDIGTRDYVRSVAISPDGLWLASGSTDSIVRLWRVVTGQEVQPMEGHDGPVTSTVFSPDGRYIASGSLDRTLKLWGAETGRDLKTFEGHTAGVASLAY